MRLSEMADLLREYESGRPVVLRGRKKKGPEPGSVPPSLLEEAVVPAPRKKFPRTPGEVEDVPLKSLKVGEAGPPDTPTPDDPRWMRNRMARLEIATGIMGMPIRTVGPGYDPRLYHVGRELILRPNPRLEGTGMGQLAGPGFYTTPTTSMLRSWKRLLRRMDPNAIPVVSKFRLNPGEKVFETTFESRAADPEDIRRIQGFLRGHGQRYEPGTADFAGIDQPWLDAVLRYNRERGLSTRAFHFPGEPYEEFVTTNPEALYPDPTGRVLAKMLREGHVPGYPVTSKPIRSSWWSGDIKRWNKLRGHPEEPEARSAMQEFMDELNTP